MARWPFIATVAAGDVDLSNARARRVTWRVGEPADASFAIDGRDAQAADIVELVSDLTVWRVEGARKLRLFRGRVGRATDRITADAHDLEVAAGDYRDVLGRRILLADQVFDAIEQATIAWNLIQHTQGQTGGALGITQGLTPTGQVRTITFQAGRTVAECIDELAKLDNGFDWEIDAERKLNIYNARRGSVTDVVLEYGGALAAIDRTFDPSAFANVVRLSGSDDLDAEIRTTSDIASRPEGRWERQIGTTDVTAQAILAAKAVQALADAEQIAPTYAARMTLGAWGGPDSFFIGDTVRLVARTGRLDVNEQVRVHELTVEPGPDGSEAVALVLAASPRPLDESAALQRRVRRLERR